MVAALIAVGLTAAVPAAADVINQTYYFTGICALGCEGNATATLVLTNYTPGNLVTVDNFVSLNYSSLSVSNYDFGTNPGIESVFPADLPASANSNVTDFSNIFGTSADGSWSFSFSSQVLGRPSVANVNDSGSGGIWTASDPTAAPEPASMTMLGIGLAACAVASRRRAKSAK